MKSFKKFIFITLLPIFLIAIVAYLKPWSFEDFRYSHINLYALGLFSIISFTYVYIYEKLILKESKLVKTYTFSIVSVFIMSLLFSLFWTYLILETSKFETAIFQSTLAVSIFLLTVFVFEIYNKSLQKEAIVINEKNRTFIILILKITLLISFFLFVMVIIPLLDHFAFLKVVTMTGRIFLFSLQFTLISFIVLRMLYYFDYFRKNIAIGVFLASITSSFLNLSLNVFWRENSVLHFLNTKK